jgi:hypothetical protein
MVLIEVEGREGYLGSFNKVCECDNVKKDI